MSISVLLKIAGVGLLVSVAYQILQKYGRDEQATFVSIAGVILVMFLIINELDSLFRTLRSVFGI
ncbi:MAG: stage III sporulation protein AC [Clostridiales bacterium]|jgi:stage III sporulation protein AC|nr:stage III sporulation protein AC [Clostridiales bacterium]PWL48103.1 MAG: stage III sporulation protein AC [Clostridiales bacterium]HJA58009.1 stage III sporulation protein AC [Bacillota bacterium]